MPNHTTLTPPAELISQPLTGMASSRTSSAACPQGASLRSHAVTVPGSGGGGL